MRLSCFAAFLLVLVFVPGVAGSLPPPTASPHVFAATAAQLDDPAFASWIAHPDDNGTDYGVFLFRRTFQLDAVPDSFRVHVAADNRYRLYVNGSRIADGSLPGLFEHWYYDTHDLAAHLRPGRNVIAIRVDQQGRHRGARQVTHRTGLAVQGEGPHVAAVNTGAAWRVWRDSSRTPIDVRGRVGGGGYIAGDTERFEAALHPWGWEQPIFDDHDWPAARALYPASHGALNTWKDRSPWLRPRPIKPLEESPGPPIRILSATPTGPTSGPLDNVTVPSATSAHFLLTTDVLTMGYPELVVSGGRGARIRLRYQEALFDEDGHKGNRGEWQGRTMLGYHDEFIPDGGKARTFEPLWLRVFRFVEVTVETAGEPLVIDRFALRFTAYPLRARGGFRTPAAGWTGLQEAAWRTVRLCALDTFMDCPYYEQLQYVGDTRIQALIALNLTGEIDLVREAIRQFDRTRRADGLIASHYPGGGVPIPPFALYHLAMMQEYLWHTRDDEAVRDLLPGALFTLAWFEARLRPDGLLGPLPGWLHIDAGAFPAGDHRFERGAPPGAVEGGGAHVTLLLAETCRRMAAVFAHFGEEATASELAARAAHLGEAVWQLCYSPAEGLIAETPDQRHFSQHTNALAILAGAVPPDRVTAVAQAMLTHGNIVRPSLYFTFYIQEALALAGLGEELHASFAPWHRFLDQGFTTFPEHGLNSRSDCHAWSAGPLYHAIASIAGIRPDAPGYRRVRISPLPGSLLRFEAEAAHPDGLITVDYARDAGARTRFTVVLPEGLEGELIWGDTHTPLHGGTQCLEFPGKP